MFVKYLDCSI